MSGGARSKKQEREQLVRPMRSSGSSWVEVAEALRQSYRLNARVAFRYAHGWSQTRAAEEWNKRWPDELKTFKNFSHWESWPGPTGHAPTYDNLSKLAELYECSVSDPLVDLPNFRHLDTAGSTKPDSHKKRLVLPGERTLDSETGASALDDGSKWAPCRHYEQQHVMRVIQDQDISGFDEPTLGYCEGMVDNLRRQDNVLGPQLTLHSTMGHRQVAEQLAKAAPEEFQPRAVSAYAS